MGPQPFEKKVLPWGILERLKANRILATDSYKLTHWKQYPPNTTKVYSYFESRGGFAQETVFFGLQYLLREYLSRPITREEIDEAKSFTSAHLRDDKLFNLEGWEHILNDHGGKFPVSIRAVPEGTVVPIKNVLMTVENTCPKCFWVTNYLETLLVQVWYPTTVATLSREMKKVILGGLNQTGDPALVDNKLHDFGFRGVSSFESAALGGCAHLVNFLGTDTTAGVLLAREVYGEPMAGYSIPASEHSTITAWGQENEAVAFANMVTQFGACGSGLYAVVSDSYNIYKACSEIWGGQLKEMVLANPNTLVIRPDSGNPSSTLMTIADSLAKAFGYTTNEKGYKVLNKIRLIQGDGIDYYETLRIFNRLIKAGWSIDNFAFGMGGGLLQKINRDTQKFAFKCSWVEVDGQGRDVFKSPVDDPGKKSKQGRLCLFFSPMRGERWSTGTFTEERPAGDLLKEVYRDGQILLTTNFKEIRERAKVTPESIQVKPVHALKFQERPAVEAMDIEWGRRIEEMPPPYKPGKWWKFWRSGT